MPIPMTRFLSSTVSRAVVAILFIAAGAAHFIRPAFYQSIVPPFLPWPHALVVISGMFEILGGAGILVRPIRPIARWGLIALLLAVYPANIYMALFPDRIPAQNYSVFLLWVRLPLQIFLIAWVWLAGKDDRKCEARSC